jgi:uncharacterized protein (TIGR00299 family) protein
VENKVKKVLYIDCFSGISGDMMVGALLDIGLDFSLLKAKLKKLNIRGYDISCREVIINSIRAKKFDVEVTDTQDKRDYGDIKKLISSSMLDEGVKNLSLNIFKAIAEAESEVHKCKISKVSFHEVGAVDSIIDIVSTAIGIKSLKAGYFYSSMIPLGKGFTRAAHGRLPVPAPATIELLKRLPVFGGDFSFEVTTPTGAAILKTIVNEFGRIPLMTIDKTGYGAGSRENKKIPNVLRILSGRMEEEYIPEPEELVILSANIDDENPEVAGYIQEKLLQDSVLDVWTEPIYMKKNRPAFKLCVLCDKKSEARVIDIIFGETTTLGIRREEVKRYKVKREIKTAELPYGKIKVKIGIYKGKEVTISPEFESCRKLAKKTGRPLSKIYQDAILFFSKR